MEKLREHFKIKKPGAFYSDAFRRRQWDGYIRYITPGGQFESGLLHDLVEHATKVLNKKVKLIDQRDMIFPDEEVTTIGDMDLRDYQGESSLSVVRNKVLKLYYPRGILKEATNAGKTLIAAGLHLSYPEDTKTVILVHRILLLNQLKKELRELLGNSEVGEVSSGVYNPKRVTICSVQTMAKNIGDIKIKRVLAQAQIAIVDECHRAASKQYGTVLKLLYNCPVRVGLSGTPLMHKDKTKNQLMINFFGPILHTTSNKTLVDRGFSTKPNINILLGETKLRGDTYKEEYDLVITNNKRRNKRIWKRIRKKLEKGKYPMLIFCKFIDHAEKLLKMVPEDIKDKYSLGIIHVKKRDRSFTLEKFRKGKIDILIATNLIAEGQNLPLIKYGLNTGGGDSVIVLMQWFGRMLRTHKTKKSVDVEDFYDLGKYLKRHSKHRVKYYKAEGFEVKETYKIQAKKKSIKII
jgi:superfamily II DNA or RNA helicase